MKIRPVGAELFHAFQNFWNAAKNDVTTFHIVRSTKRHDSCPQQQEAEGATEVEISAILKASKPVLRTFRWVMELRWTNLESEHQPLFSA